jgi:hypothetical protein
MRLVACIAIALLSPVCSAQQRIEDFPRATIAFLDGERPGLEKAVAAKDRSYFESANARMVSFLQSWGLGSAQAPAIDRYPMCAEAVTGFFVGGLCRISPPGSLCEPSTYLPKVDAFYQQCKSASRANNAFDSGLSWRRFAGASSGGQLDR